MGTPPTPHPNHAHDSPDRGWATKRVTIWTHTGVYISLLTAHRALYILSWYSEWWLERDLLDYVPATIQTGMCVVILVESRFRCVVLFTHALRTTTR